jgi:hypothetical protein
MGGVVTEEEAIARAQYLDLVYSQSGTLYELIPNATRATNDPSKPSSHLMRMELLAPSKPNLLPSRLEQSDFDTAPLDCTLFSPSNSDL